MAVPQAVAHTPIVVGPGLSPLEGARIDVRIDDLLAEFTLTQSFRNGSRDDIEAVFTFPVPVDAVFLGLNATLGERELEGQVIEKQQARRTYEQSIAQGDSAVLVERTENGLLTTNIGNLKPGETIVLRLRFAQWLSFSGHAVTFRMPTTIAPRYGRPAMDEREAPVTDLLAQYRFAARLRITGLLATARLASPSHAVAIERDGDCVALTLQSAWMDRDFLMEAGFGEVERCGAVADRDGEGHIVSVAVAADFTGEDAPLDVVLVVDCSGSMGGTSIDEARKAMKQILHGLGEQDRIDLVRYGSSHHSAFGRLRELSRETRSQLEEQIAATEANLGGTETVGALESAAATIVRDSAGSERSRVLFLVTDGAIHSPNIARLEATCRAHGIRIFVVGVGLAHGEAAVQAFAQATGGAAETVHPNQDMAAKVVRHFHRVRKPPGTITRIDWPAKPSWAHVPEYFHSGDTIRIFARFDQPVSGEVAVHWQSREAGQACLPIRIAAPTDEPISTLARMAASVQFGRTSERSAQVDLALRYQLLTQVSSAILVAPRSADDKAGDQPTTVRVPQMMASGWGGAADMEMDGICCLMLGPPVIAARARPPVQPPPSPNPSATDAACRDFIGACLERIDHSPSREMWKFEDLKALLRWMDAAFEKLVLEGGDLAAGVEALMMRWQRTEAARWPILVFVSLRCSCSTAAEILGTTLRLKHLAGAAPMPGLDALVAQLRAKGMRIKPASTRVFQDVHMI
jgi:Ca-activated chloride channel family protein